MVRSATGSTQQIDIALRAAPAFHVKPLRRIGGEILRLEGAQYRIHAVAMAAVSRTGRRFTCGAAARPMLPA